MIAYELGVDIQGIRTQTMLRDKHLGYAWLCVGTGIDIEFITDKGDTQRKTVALTKLWEIDSRDVMTHPALAAWMKGDKSGTSPSTSVQTPLLPPTSVQTSKAKVIPVYTVRDPPTSELYGTEWMLTIPASVVCMLTTSLSSAWQALNLLSWQPACLSVDCCNQLH